MNRSGCIHCAESLNQTIGAIGLQGTGKSTWAAARAMQLAQEHGAFIVAHDPEGNIPVDLPADMCGFRKGTPTNVRMCETVEHARAAFAVKSEGIVSICSVDAQPALDFALELAEADKQRHKSESPPGRELGHPVVFFLDEIVNAEDASPHFFGKHFKQALMLRRHKNLMIVWTSQDPGLVHHQLLSKCTEMALFAIQGDRGVDRLRSVGCPDDLLSRAQELPDYEHVLWVPRLRGKSIVSPTEGTA